MEFYLIGVGCNLLALMALILFLIVVTFFSTIINNYNLSEIVRFSVAYEKQKDDLIKKKTTFQIYFKIFKIISIFLPYVYAVIACYTFLKILYQWTKHKTFLEFIFKDYFEIEV
nr:MAG TPA: hypothetical protein [Caudoviricetes sp.]